MKTAALASRILAGFLLLPRVCLAQWLGQIQTESDWEASYSLSYFDYNTYQIYRELAEGATVTDSLDFFRAALGSPVLEFLGGAGGRIPVIAAPDTVEQHAFVVRIRGGQKIRSGESNYGYILFSGSKEDAAFELKGRKRKHDWEIERRSIELRKGRSQITLGNFDTDIGLGLSIGRFDYRPIAGMSDSMKQPDNFVFPDNSYYNGIKFDYCGSTVIFSNKKFPGLKKRLFGGAVTSNYEDVTIGVSGVGIFLSAGGYNRALGSTSLFFADPVRGIRVEIAYAEAGPGAALRLRRSGFDWAIWHYDRSYLNLQSSGVARPDYDRFEDPHFTEAFRQPQAGETGLFAEKGLAVGRFDLGAATEIWKGSPRDQVALENLVSARFRLTDRIALDARLSGRTGLSNDRVITEIGSNLNGIINIHARASLWNERGEVAKSRSFCYIYFSVPSKIKFLFNGRIRSYFDGDWDYFIEEIVNLAGSLRAKVTYRWQESYHDNVGPLYLVLEAAI